MRRMILLVLAAVLPACVARADDCATATDQRAMTECVGNAFKQSDAVLNATYAKIQSRLKDDPDTTKLLVAAQRSWIAFRDAECRFASSISLGGTIYPMVYAGCADRLTRRRVDDLKAYLRCSVGELSCPVPPG